MICEASLFSLAHFFCASNVKGDCEMQTQFSLSDRISIVVCHLLRNFIKWRNGTSNLESHFEIYLFTSEISGPDSSVGLATELRAGRSRYRNLVGVRFSAPVQTGPGAHPASCAMGTGSSLGVESGQGMMLTPHPLLVLRSKRNRLELYLYSP
jgi:hypothetical protein